MQLVVLLIVLGVIAFLLYKSVQDARERAAGQQSEPRTQAPTRRATPRPRPARKSKPAPPQPKLDEESLAAHVAKLREAVDADLISVDEAVASIVRQTDGAVGEEAARRLLAGDSAT